MILIVLFVSLTAFADTNQEMYNDAGKKALEAAYIQSGVQKNIENYIKWYEERIPEKYKKIVGIVYPIVDTAIKQKVEFKYEF